MLTAGHAVHEECANRGICNRLSGTCACAAGFEGPACERMKCPGSDAPCSGSGSCKTMAELATLAAVNGDRVPQAYGTTGASATWDADMITGCYCDTLAYHGPISGDLSMSAGHACARFVCPAGDDPETGGGVFEVQRLTCNATGGLLSLGFRQQTTGYMNAATTMKDVKVHLEELTTVQSLTIT